MSTFLKIFFPTTGIVCTLGGKVYLHYSEQMAAKSAKLAELVKEKHDIALKLNTAKEEIALRVIESPVSPNSDIYIKLAFAFVLGGGLTLACCYIPTINSLAHSGYVKFATFSGIKVNVAELRGLDADGNQVIAQLVGDIPTIKLFFGSENQEFLIGSLISSSRVYKKKYDLLFDEFTKLKATSINENAIHEKLSSEYPQLLAKLDDLNMTIIVLEEEISRLTPMKISVTEAVALAMDSLN